MKLADELRQSAGTVKQDFPSPYGKVFASLDPSWRKWGILRKGKPTLWFHRKADADRCARTGDESLALKEVA